MTIIAITNDGKIIRKTEDLIYNEPNKGGNSNG